MLNNNAKYYTPKMIQEIYNISRTTVWRWTRCDDSPLPYIKIRGKILFDAKVVDEWIAKENLSEPSS